MPSTLAIINSVSMERKLPDICWRVLRTLDRIPDRRIERTRYAGHAAVLAKEAAAYDNIIAVGGDGTIHEIVNNMDLQRQTLGIIPSGTCNTTAQHLGINSIESAGDIILQGTSLAMDLIKVRVNEADTSFERLMIETASIGLIADSVMTANRHLKRLGPLCYTAGTVIRLFSIKPFEAAMTIDGKGSLITATNFVLNNVPLLGNYLLFRDASVRDGMFDYAAADLGFFGQIMQGAEVITGHPLNKTSIMGQARELDIKLSLPKAFMIDGEIFPDIREVNFSVMPGALKCFAPAASTH